MLLVRTIAAGFALSCLFIYRGYTHLMVPSVVLWEPVNIVVFILGCLSAGFFIAGCLYPPVESSLRFVVGALIRDISTVLSKLLSRKAKAT